MAIRVTNGQSVRNIQADVATVYEKLVRTQREISSGVRVERPSDDPFGASQILDLDAQMADAKQYAANAKDAMSFLDAADTALGSMTDAFHRIRDLVLQAANTSDQPSLDTIAAEITQLKEVVRDNANAKYGSQFIFSGRATATAPYPAGAGNAYQGNLVVLERQVSNGVSVVVNADGPSVLGNTVIPAGPANQLSSLDLIDRIVADMTSGNPVDLETLRTDDLAALDARFDQILQVRTELGARGTRLETTAETLSILEERLLTARSQVADVDTTKAYIDFQNQQNMFQAALAAGTRMMQTSILDFI